MNLATFIADPTLPLPPMRKKARERVEALREAYKVAMGGRAARAKANTPELVRDIMAPLAAGLSVERLWLLPLDAQSNVIGTPVILSEGYADSTDVSIPKMLRAALIATATSFVLCHNHPTGDPTPSAADVGCTITAVRGARAVGLIMSDHVIIGACQSFRSIRRCSPSAFT